MSRARAPIADEKMADIEALFDRLLEVDRDSDEFTALYREIDAALEALIADEPDHPSVASLLLEPKGTYRISRAG